MTSNDRDMPPLIPAPRHFAYGTATEAFLIDATTEIVIGAEAGEETLFAARQLKAAVRDATGLTLALRRAYAPLDGTGRLALLRVDRDEGIPQETLAELGPEGYTLEVTPQRIVVAANTEAGLFYGVQTLRQLLRTQGRRIPALTIRDWPALAHRGVMLDISRGKVPTLQTLFALVDGLAEYKYNHLQLYTEHTFSFPSHPAISAGADPLTADDILALDRYCRERHIELVPNLQSYGHLRRMLSLPQYAHLDEVGWQWSLTPAREETYRLLDELYAEFLPAFSSRWFNVNCDETWDLGTGQSKALAQEIGKGRLYLRHILRLRELAAKHGRRIMLWADILLYHPELVSELPSDVLLLDWWYEAQDRYPSAERLGTLGREFWVCPGTSSWNTLFPRLDNALVNIRNFVRDGLAAGATGMLLTDWGDYGHYQPLSLSWYPYLYGAATAWTGARTTPEEFDRAFAPLFLSRPAGDRSIQAIRRLGRAVMAPTLGLRNRSNSAYALFDDPLAGKLVAAADPGALAELEAAAHDALQAWAQLPNPALRHDYTFVARLIAFAASKVLLSQRLRRTLRSLPDPVSDLARSEGLAQLDADIAALRASRSQLAALAREFELCWLRHARRSEIHLTLDRFAALDRRYEAALAWLDEQRGRYASGQPVDAEATSYDPGPYYPLWEEGLQSILRLVDLIGKEELPPDLRQYLEQEGLI